MSAEELADPRLISTTDLESRLATIITNVVLGARDDTLERLELQYGDAPVAGVSNFDGIARNAINVALSEGRISQQARPIMEDVIDRTLDRLDSDVHSPRIDVPFGARHRQDARFYARNIEFSTRDAANEMLDRMRTETRNAAMAGEQIDQIVARIENEFDRSKIRSRARVIALMEIQNAINSTKLHEYERSADIDGIRIINPCNQNTTRLCLDLAGCGPADAVTAWFDDERSLATQLHEEIGDDLLFEGFRPLPPMPPFHFGCRSEIGPAIRNE